MTDPDSTRRPEMMVVGTNLDDLVGPEERPCGRTASPCRRLTAGTLGEVVAASRGERVPLITVWPGEVVAVLAYCRTADTDPEEPGTPCPGTIITAWAVDESGRRVGDLTLVPN